MGGAKNIASLLERYQGNTVLALSAYNARNGNVDEYKDVPFLKDAKQHINNAKFYKISVYS